MKKIFYILSAAAILSTACTREMTPEQSVRPTTTVAPDEGDMALVTFKVNVPEAALYSTPTRAQHQMGDQPSIADGDLYVAVFGGGDDEKIGGNLQHFLKAKLKNTIEHDVDMVITTTTTTDEVTGEETTTTTTTRAYIYEYEVLLPLSNDPLVLQFMVGACDKDGNLYTLENPLPVKYEAELMPTLYSLNGYAAYSQRVRVNGVFPKVVDGEYVMTDYQDDGGAMLPDADQDYVAEDIAALEYVQLIRNFAKVTFSANSNAPFTLEHFCLLDTPVSGSVAPYSTSAGYNTVYTTATSAGAVMGTYEGYVNSQVLSSGIDWDNKKLEPGQFDYMYERTVPSYSTNFAESGAMLEVKWKDIETVDEALRGQTRYYKVVFKGNDGYMPILRNIQYDFEMEDIVSEQHYTSPADAYAGTWLGDVSANVATAMLDEIGNGKSNIKVSEMSKTSIGDSKSFDIDFYFYPIAGNSEVVVTNGNASTAAGGKTVTITTAMMTEGTYDQAIESVSAPVVTHNSDNSDNHATVTVTVKASETGKVLKGKVRILGQVQGMTALYRDVIFTVMEKQDFMTGSTESSITKMTADAMGQDVTVTIQLPEALPRDMFPLQIKIEAQNNGLYSVPDTSVDPEISALPVKSGPSAFTEGKNSYYFLKTITYDEYATLNGLTYEYTTAFPCKFKTRLAAGSNATKIRINDLNNEYFNETELDLEVGS